VRIPIVFGLVAGTSGSRKKSILSLLSFISGLVISYTLLGILLGIAGDVTSRLIPITKYIYAALGVLIMIVGIFVSGLFPFRSLHLHSHIADRFKRTGYLGTFFFGIALALIEMPTCPCCAPILLIIASSVIANGSFAYSVLVFMSFAIGQSLPTLVIGMSTSIAKYLTPKIEKFEGYIRLVAGNILIVFGIYFILIA